MIISKPKNVEYTEGTLQLDKFVVSCDNDENWFIENYIHMFINIEIEFVKSNETNISICRNTQLRSGEYIVGIDSNIVIEYNDNVGLRNALATLIQLLNEENQVFYIKKQKIMDYPECQFRSVMIDLAR